MSGPKFRKPRRFYAPKRAEVKETLNATTPARLSNDTLVVGQFPVPYQSELSVKLHLIAEFLGEEG